MSERDELTDPEPPGTRVHGQPGKAAEAETPRVATVDTLPPAEAEFASAVVARDRPHAAAALRAAGGDHAGAAELYMALVARAPDDVDALVGLSSALLGLGQYEAAEREIRRAIRVAPERADVRLQLGIALYKRAVYPAAAAELRRTVELDRDCLPAYLLLGESLNQLGEPDGAIEVLEHVVSVEANAKAFYALGIAFDRKGQPERAAEMYRRSRELNGR